jgi:5-methylcytosine-specific restriction enzyme subunit McrC
MPSTHYPRLEDSLINQVLLQGLHLAAHFTSDTAMRLQLYRLINVLQEAVSSIVLDHHVLTKLRRQMDRLTMAYQPAITIIAIPYHAGGMALQESQPRVPLPGFLFDMNLFFQELLSRFFREHLREYDVSDQYRIPNMLSYDLEHNPRNRRTPQPRPDYVIAQQGRLVSILDAKYRDLWENELPPHMLYQLVMYALSQPDGVAATILYPTLQSDIQEARIAIHDPLHGTNRAFVVLRPVNLLYLAHLLAGAKSAYQERVRVSFAKQLAFGGATRTGA